MSTTRRLAAIMFTDIEGYTKLMGENEPQAQILRKRHREVFERLHEQYNGEIIQYFGDGTLSIFNSCVEAAKCAIEMQQEFQKDPKVPLRIGLHLGDIEYSKTDVAGNGVNIASRVESLGVAGSVLLSNEVRKQVDNHGIQVLSMGKFDMKNVKEHLEVFAVVADDLVVPDPKKLEGKGERISETLPPTSKPKNIVKLASIGFIVMALGAVLFWALGSSNLDGQLSEKIKEERVAIIPFSNRTTNNDLEVFGAFCSDLITNGLTEAGIKTCSPRTIQQYNHLIGVLPNNPDGKPSFSEVVGARYWVEGNFSQIGDTILVKSYLTDGTNGDIVRNFPEVKGHIDEKESLVNDLTKRLMGYWVARDVIDRGKFKPPKYEAFMEYQKIFTSSGWWGNNSSIYGLKAFALDSSFYLAALDVMFWQADRRRSLYDSIYDILAPHYDQMTAYEQTRFDANKALYERDYSNYTKYNEALFQMFPQDLSQTAYYSFHLSFRENQPLKAWQVGNAIDWENISEDLYSFRKGRMFYISLDGLGAKKYQETIEFLDAYRPQEGRNYQIKSFIYSRTYQLDSLYALADRLKTSPKQSLRSPLNPEYDLVDFCNDVGEEFLLQGKGTEAKQFLQMAIEWTAEKPERLSTTYDSLDLARTYRLLGSPEKSLSLEESFIKTYIESGRGGMSQQRYFSGIGIDYALLGQEEKAKEIIANFNPGWGPQYFKARIHAVLGEKEEVMRLCKEWRSDWGWSYSSFFFYKHDYFMKNMFGYEPFEEFTRVRD